ncbi:IMP dehydrogenase [Candidatus Roizmanbacteria bacterium CG_4_10_14_0_2_um_filter_36_35]|uniref:IMP dehydrogenase n=3 Tax=Candidatus Roizmaniibacteriota TaxID=1752723 RepID=A0A2M7BVK7_9BACT|nr:MAG: IMP dehydrogenase [Candidatus Roizmanbacteria bacterium CG03_land_8_20_14_0_80_35_26]PIZ68456.1 MAG: IMP dehydrogenase [Candidatus Roizmanbacteria bacterium CG_4_10_14_0_2_um_filter_36_35]PJC32395.1 MAG: IMP dehydrogenase [Candidatus Roizmanbacteria bacterium CG_4_9_14_0_2_um_filter_36_12]
MKLEEGLTYDDVLLIPQKSFIDHRSDVSTKTKLTRNISLNIPFISANMDTVTEAEMAIALAREGGIGIIHRFMTVEEEVEQVNKVKRSVGFIVDNPYTVMPNMPLKKIIDKAKKLGVNGFIVVDEKGKLVGILSRRDYSFENGNHKKARDLMTPLKKLITGKVKIKMSEAEKIFNRYKIEKLPLIDREGRLKGLITARSIRSFERYSLSSKDLSGRYLVGAAVGVVNDYLERAEALVNAGADVIVVDVAHGHNNIAMKAIATLRKKFKNIDLIGGNVATAEGARDLIELGVDAVKVGIGPGGLCTTRIVAGVGVPQFTAVLECFKVAKRKGVPVIADGGTNYPGDMAKALAVGGSTCMLAGWFAGTDESPGGIIMRKGMEFKVHRGSASFLATADRKIELENHNEYQLNTIVPEGIEAMVPYKGKVSDVIYQLVGALRSGMSYCNAKTIPQLWENARFIKITEAGFRESKSHNVEEL